MSLLPPHGHSGSDGRMKTPPAPTSVLYRASGPPEKPRPTWPETGPAPQAAPVPRLGGASGVRSGRLAASAEGAWSGAGGLSPGDQPLHELRSTSLEDRDPKGGERRPKAKGRSLAPADHSPCLAPLENPTPALGQGERPPWMSPKTTRLSLGSLPSWRGNTSGLGGQQVWKLPYGPWGSRRGPREAYRDKAGVSGQSPCVLTGGQKEDTWGAPRDSVVPRKPASRGQRQ